MSSAESPHWLSLNLFQSTQKRKRSYFYASFSHTQQNEDSNEDNTYNKLMVVSFWFRGGCLETDDYKNAKKEATI
jgi:hypothetical protein